MLKCSKWLTKIVKHQHVVTRSCGHYTARLVRGKYGWVGYVTRRGRVFDRVSADNLMKAKHQANKRLTGR